MDKTFETKDLATAVYLKANNEYCIGTIPAGNKYRPEERLWLFEDTTKLRVLVQRLKTSDPIVPIKKAFSCATILKNLLNDKDDFNDGQQQK